MSKDPIIAEVRRARETEAAKHGFDVKAILAAAKNDTAALATGLSHSFGRIRG